MTNAQGKSTPSQEGQLAKLLTDLVAGKVTAESAMQSLQLVSTPQTLNGSENQSAKIDNATVDLGRKNRCGFGEVIYGEGKDTDLICRIIEVQHAAGQNALVTRVHPDSLEVLIKRFPAGRANTVARTFTAPSISTSDLSALPCPAPKTIDDSDLDDVFHAAVVTAGSTDAPIGEEAIETLSWMNIPMSHFTDIGVAGPQRLLDALPRLKKASVVVVIAGMEGALPAAVAGHLSVPIIAVPTSVGYGATLGGITPLLGMLSSCAANVSVVNIDAGFKGGYLAGLIVDQLKKHSRNSD